VTGITYDTVTKLFYATTGSQIVTFSATSTTATPFAGGATAGTSNGLALSAYPLQFNTGNVVGGAGAAVAPFNGANISAANGSLATANTNAAAQKTAGISAFLAGLTSPTGISYEPVKGYFYWLEPAQTTPQLRVAQ
jgi:hypothetical protein